MADRNALARELLGPDYFNALSSSASAQNALSPLATLKPGPEPTGWDKVFDNVYGWLGGLPQNRATASALTNLFDVGTLGMATGAYDGARDLAQTGRPEALAMALMPGAKPVAKVIPKAAAEARKAAAEILRAMRNSPHEYYGLRATPDALEVGKPAPHSMEWDRDVPTDVKLPGASTVGIDPYKSTSGPGSIPWALERMGYDVGGKSHLWDKYASKGDQVSIIGSNKRMRGQDTGEWILDGDVVAVLKSMAEK